MVSLITRKKYFFCVACLHLQSKFFGLSAGTSIRSLVSNRPTDCIRMETERQSLFTGWNIYTDYPNEGVVNLHTNITHSTHTWAVDHIQELIGRYAKDYKYVVVTADKQTNGVGLERKPWLSPKGNVFSTFVFPYLSSAHLNTSKITSIPLLVGLAALKALEEYFPAEILHLKWVNDVVLSNRKLGGILCAVEQVDDYTVIFASIGINVEGSETFPSSEVDMSKYFLPPTSIFVYQHLLKTRMPTVSDVTKVLATKISSMLLPKPTELKQYVDEIESRLVLLNDYVKVDDQVYGKFMGIVETGEAVLKVNEEYITLSSGSMRPANELPRY